MLTRLLNWLGRGETPGSGTPSRQAGAKRSSRRAAAVRIQQDSRPQTADGLAPAPPAPTESPLIRNKYLREDTGTHETLKILDDSIIESGEEEGFDPYNTGDFDRSRNWERRFRD